MLKKWGSDCGWLLSASARRERAGERRLGLVGPSRSEPELNAHTKCAIIKQGEVPKWLKGRLC